MKQQYQDMIIEELLTKYNLQLISGKYFMSDEFNATHEVNEKEIYLKMTQIASSIFAKRVIIHEADIKELIKILQLSSDENASWPPLDIITEAKKKKNIYCTKKLPIDLEYKQLVIINRLLFHPDDEIMFITTGVGGSGKSTFLNLIRQLFNNDSIDIPLHELKGFNLSEACKHRLISSDELGKGEMKNDTIKTIISKQKMYVDVKGTKGFTTKWQSSLFYCCNTAPIIDITDSGILRRIVYYERNTKIKNPDKTANNRIFTHEELLTIAVAALFAETDDWHYLFADETHKYLVQNNSLYIAYQHIGANIKSYNEYVDFCKWSKKSAYSINTYYSMIELFKEWNIINIDDIPEPDWNEINDI